MRKSAFSFVSPIACAWLWLLLGLLNSTWARAEQNEISPNEVFVQALLIEKETDLIRRFHNIAAVPAPEPIHIDLQPRHVWQRAYVILLKINLYRRKQGMNTLAPVGLEPQVKLKPRDVWAQTQRALTEIRIIRRFMNIPGEVSMPLVVEDKQPIDVFNKLGEVLALWDGIVGTGFAPSVAYAEALRLNEDVNMLLRQQHVFDNVSPPPQKSEGTPQNSLDAAFIAMDEIQRLQRNAGLDTVDFTPLHKAEKATLGDVVNMICMLLAETQQLKFRAGLAHAFTPPPEYQENRQPAETAQLLGYITNKLRLLERI